MAASECPICLENLAKWWLDERVIVLPCDHKFHRECINEWWEHVDVFLCPYCQQELIVNEEWKLRVDGALMKMGSMKHKDKGFKVENIIIEFKQMFKTWPFLQMDHRVVWHLLQTAPTCEILKNLSQERLKSLTERRYFDYNKKRKRYFYLP